MTIQELANFLAISDKLDIQFDPSLSDVQKEIFKKAIDEIRKLL